MGIRIIETFYNNYRFRSRTEARWAVLLDNLGIDYQYEKEGYDLDGVRYLPDFWLPKQDCWVEIKGDTPTTDENEKASRLALGTMKDVFILWGEMEPFWSESIPLMSLEESKRIFNETGKCTPISKLKYHGTLGHKFYCRNGEIYCSDTFWRFTECPVCCGIELTLWGDASDLSCGHIKDDDERSRCGYNTERLLIAYRAARRARFEHGQNGDSLSNHPAKRRNKCQ